MPAEMPTYTAITDRLGLSAFQAFVNTLEVELAKLKGAAAVHRGDFERERERCEREHERCERLMAEALTVRRRRN
jgi:hypothetical protein